MHDLQLRLDFALEQARQAGELILRYWRTADLAIERKEDASPVTLADRGAEELLRAAISATFPDDGILGEEFGETAGTSDYRWVLDPIDGTKAFVAGVPLFGTLIGLQYQGECVLGVCRFPALDEVVYAAQGSGAWLQRGAGDPQAVRVRETTSLAEAMLCFTDVECWEKTGRLDCFTKLSKRCRLTRGWGDCYGHMLVATGRADVMVDPLLNPWDAAALVPIVVEAGGRFSDFTGARTIEGNCGMSVVPGLADEVLGIVGGTMS